MTAYVNNHFIEGDGEQKVTILTPEIYATSASTLTLVATSSSQIVFYGSTAGQIVKLPDARTLRLGHRYLFWNVASTLVTVNYNDSSLCAVCRPPYPILTITLYDNSTAKGLWAVSLSTSASGFGSFSGAFFDSASEYIEVSSTNWYIISSFFYPGSLYYYPSEFDIIGSRDGTTGTANTRLVDYTNGGSVIASIDFTSATKAIYATTSFANLPTGAAIFEIQAKKSAAGASKVRIHSAILR